MTALESIFKPTGVAILGASPNNGAATQLLDGLLAMGYDPSRVFPVNPKYDEFQGLPCHPSVQDLPDSVSTAAIVTGAKTSVSLLEAAGEAGLEAAAMYAVGFNEIGEDGGRLEARLQEVATRHGMAVVGPNCMGALAPAYSSALYIGSLPEREVLAGHTGVVSQSGSAAIAMLSQAPRVGGFSLVASSGNETVCTAADYLQYMAADPETRVIAMFLESVRDPEGFRKGADAARRAGKPVLALKVGKNELAAQNVRAHTGALAGSARVASAFLDSCGIHEVDTLGELLEAITALTHPLRPRGRRLGVIHPSGGEASLFLDIADGRNFEIPALADAGRERLEREVHPWFASARNPLDAWGPVSYEDSYRVGLDVLGAQDDVDVVLVLHDGAKSLTDDPPDVSLNIAALAAAAQHTHDKPVFFLSNLNTGFDEQLLESLQAEGMVGLVGTDAGTRALDIYLDARVRGTTDPDDLGEPGHEPGFRTSGRPELGDGPLTEVEAMSVLDQFGLQAPEHAVAADAESAVAIADELGFPVVIKAVPRGVLHKSDLGLVATGVADEAGVRAAVARIDDALGSIPTEGFLVARQLEGFRELILGMRNDELFGPVVVLGAGGVMAEVLDDVAIGLPPISRQRARRMVSSLRVAPTLDDWRGDPAADVDALVDAVIAMGDFAAAMGDVVSEAEVNPLAVLPDGQGVAALDAVVVPVDLATARGSQDPAQQQGPTAPSPTMGEPS